MGWVTVIAYAVTCFFSCRHYLKIERQWRLKGNSRLGTLWLMVAMILALLTINKQLDLQSLLTAIGKCIAQSQGWYNNRRVVQMLFLGAIGIGALSLFSFVIWKIRDLIPHIKLVLGGIFILLTFVMMRALSFHHFDLFINFRLLGLRMNWLLELSGIALILIAALQEPRIKRPTSF